MNRRLLALSVTARLPHGMFSVAVLVHVAHVTGSYAVAGACTAVLGVGQAVGGPLAGRLVDRHGQTLVLAISTGGCALGLVMLALAGRGAPTGRLLVGSVLVGLCAPPVGPCLRALVPDLVRTPSARRRAYALDAAITEITWVAGPVVTFAVAGRYGTGSALVAAAVVLTAAVAGFASCAASRRWRPAPVVTARPSALGPVDLRVLVLVLVGVGVVFGATEVAVTAMSASLGAGGAAGPLLGLWGLGSLCGGVATARSATGGAQTGRGLALLLAALAAGHAAPAAAGGHWLALGVLITVAGSMIAPVLGTAYGMVDRIAPTGSRTEAFAWSATATAVGSAVGAALAGVLVEEAGAAAGFLLAAAGAALAAVLAGTRLRLGARTDGPGTAARAELPAGPTRTTPSVPHAPHGPQDPGRSPRRDVR
ncbi:MFS transporter [Cellulomonas sp. 179-A 9B4 NHS]|uniref:MFS transporter n=1 Tax=Cellulomonas sp. 179-A 9B4 NHS TaxID=3142379 RepID=UPI0039A14FD7